MKLIYFWTQYFFKRSLCFCNAKQELQFITSQKDFLWDYFIINDYNHLFGIIVYMTPQGAKSACVSCVKWEKRRGARTWLAFGRNKTRTFNCLRFKTSDYWQKSNACFFASVFWKKASKMKYFKRCFICVKVFVVRRCRFEFMQVMQTFWINQ